MDHPLINESSFSTDNPSAYSLAEIWPFSGEPGNAGLGIRVGHLGRFVETHVSMEESTVTVTDQSGARKRKEGSSEMVSTSSADNLNSSKGKRAKIVGSKDEDGAPKGEDESSSAPENKTTESLKGSEPSKQDYIHVRVRRGQATDNHSLAERARREKISERMKFLQDLVPSCNKVIGKAIVLDEIINYIQSLQRQVEFMSMKLEAVNSTTNLNPSVEAFSSKDVGATPFDASRMLFVPQAAGEYIQCSHPEWLHM
ncbi:hypothetical protein SAY87_010784 [Trapa incisa]|uniref:BHLH domain-containing protein n=1 Tax=Trapa incisa TaxID=236973 RepID=A0AAN7JI94_9MYRT|nr:hypothetical protein SAY87_010784 [Trapa incisa]